MTESIGRRDRGIDELRPVRLDRGVIPHAEGSCMISTGRTRVLCTATVEEDVPAWRAGSGRGWVTAEYAMLPRSTTERIRRERGRVKGRTKEIQRLIGRSLRAAVDLDALGERMILIDCDVIIADGGTRTAAITGAAVALYGACNGLVEQGRLDRNPVTELIAAVSVGVVDGEPRLDLDYREDSAAAVDMNIAALESGGLVEVQGTAEEGSMRREELDRLVDLGTAGIEQLVSKQRDALVP